MAEGLLSASHRGQTDFSRNRNEVSGRSGQCERHFGPGTRLPNEKSEK